MTRGFIQIRLIEKKCKLTIKWYRTFCVETISQLKTIITKIGSADPEIVTPLYTDVDWNKDSFKELFVTSVCGDTKELDYHFLMCFETSNEDQETKDRLLSISENMGGMVRNLFYKMMIKSLKHPGKNT